MTTQKNGHGHAPPSEEHMLHYLKEFPQSQYSFRDSSTLYSLSETQEEVFSECSCDDVRKSEEQIEKSGPSQLDDVRC